MPVPGAITIVRIQPYNTNNIISNITAWRNERILHSINIEWGETSGWYVHPYTNIFFPT